MAAALGLGACGMFEAELPPPRAAPAAPAPAPAPPPPTPRPAPAPPPDLARPADRVARRLLAYNEKISQLAPADLAAEIARLDALVSAPPAPESPDVVLQLSLALAVEHNPGDLARAGDLIDPIAASAEPDFEPWQAVARLLAGRIAEERRLEDQLDRQAAQRRDTQQKIQQLTEKLEALKAIERSMTARSGGGAAGADQAPPAPAPHAP